MFLGASGLHIAKQIGPLSLYGGMDIRSDDPSKLYGNCGVFMNSTDHAVKHMMTFGGIITRPLVIQSIVRALGPSVAACLAIDPSSVEKEDEWSSQTAPDEIHLSFIYSTALWITGR